MSRLVDCAWELWSTYLLFVDCVRNSSFWATSLESYRSPNDYAVFNVFHKSSPECWICWQIVRHSSFSLATVFEVYIIQKQWYVFAFFCKWSWSLIEKRVSTEIGVAVSSFCFLGPWGTLESCDAMESQWRGLCCDHFVVCRSSLLELEICRSRSAFGAQHCEYGVMVHVMKFVSEIM